MSKKRLYKPKNVDGAPRFPYGGTNRIRFKGYNLSRMAPPSKKCVNLCRKGIKIFQIAQLPTKNCTKTHQQPKFAQKSAPNCTKTHQQPKFAQKTAPNCTIQAEKIAEF